MLCRALRSLVFWKGVGRLQIPNHPWYKKYAAGALFYFIFHQGNVGDPFSAAATFAKKRAEQLERQKKEDVYGSPAQQEARRQAAESIKKKAAGFAAR